MSDIKIHKSALVDFTEQLSATGERLKIRQDEHAELVTATANNAGTSKLLGLAISRRNKFYVLASHKATLKAELSAEDRVHEPVAETFTSKFEETKSFHGVVALLKKLIADAERDMVEVQTEEKNSHKQFEESRRQGERDHGTQ